MFFGDLSILPRPLTWQDIFDLEAERDHREKLRSWERVVWEDLRFYVARLSACFTGSEGNNYLPSYVKMLEANMEAQGK